MCELQYKMSKVCQHAIVLLIKLNIFTIGIIVICDCYCVYGYAITLCKQL